MQYVRRILSALINEATRVSEVSTITSCVGKVTMGRPDYAAKTLNMNIWHDVVSWWTDGEVVAILVPKLSNTPSYPVTPVDWF